MLRKHILKKIMNFPCFNYLNSETLHKMFKINLMLNKKPSKTTYHSYQIFISLSPTLTLTKQNKTQHIHKFNTQEVRTLELELKTQKKNSLFWVLAYSLR